MTTIDNTNAANTAPEVKLTREQKLVAKLNVLAGRINKDTESYNEIKAELDNIAALAAIAVGSVVIVKLGRKFADKDTTRFEQGVVVGVKEEEDGSKLYKVQYGEGFDADIAVVTGGSLSLPTPVVDPVPGTEGQAATE